VLLLLLLQGEEESDEDDADREAAAAGAASGVLERYSGVKVGYSMTACLRCCEGLLSSHAAEVRMQYIAVVLVRHQWFRWCTHASCWHFPAGAACVECTLSPLISNIHCVCCMAGARGFQPR
jgi:hypothetical protein